MTDKLRKYFDCIVSFITENPIAGTILFNCKSKNESESSRNSREKTGYFDFIAKRRRRSISLNLTANTITMIWASNDCFAWQGVFGTIRSKLYRARYFVPKHNSVQWLKIYLNIIISTAQSKVLHEIVFEEVYETVKMSNSFNRKSVIRFI